MILQPARQDDLFPKAARAVRLFCALDPVVGLAALDGGDAVELL